MSQEAFDRIVEDIIFSGGNVPLLLEKHGLELKPEKTVEDFKVAFKKGYNKSPGKFEREVMNASIAIQRVCRIKKK